MGNSYIWQIVITAIVAMIIGSLWYSPLLFGKQWMELAGQKEMDENAKKGLWKFYLGQLIMTLVSLSIFAFFLSATGASGAKDGALLGFFVWLGFIFTKDMSLYFWENRSFKYIMITTGASLVTWVVCGAILGAWIF